MNSFRAAQLTTSFLRRDGGGPVTFSRVVDITATPPTRIYARVPYAQWRNYRPEELGNGVMQGDSLMIIQGNALGILIDGLGTPPRMNDKVTAGGFERNVQSAGDVIFVTGRPVRVNLTLRG